MERTISVEEKIRRAEEIYNRRKGNENRNTARVNLEKKKNTSALKKMRNQIIICVIIYFIFYGLANNNFIFSEDLKSKVNEILSYEVDFKEIYLQICNYFDNLKFDLIKEEKEEKKTDENSNQSPDNIEDTNKEDSNSEDSDNNTNPESNNLENNNQVNNDLGNNEPLQNNVNIAEIPIENSIGGASESDINEGKELTEEEQMKQDAEDIKKSVNFIIPVQGTITSKYGTRSPTVSTVSKYHTGLDIGAVLGTDIISATDGKVVSRSTTGDYGYHLKIEKDDLIIIYAHCSKLLVNEGEEIKQGQKIAEVGSTGNSTGPHLHFEIRKSGRYVDPQMILDI